VKGSRNLRFWRLKPGIGRAAIRTYRFGWRLFSCPLPNRMPMAVQPSESPH